MNRAKSLILTLVIPAAAIFVCGWTVGASFGREPFKRFVPLLETTTTVLDEPIVYPSSGPAKLTTGTLQFEPGEETGWHFHSVPSTGIILEGELTVDYGDKGKRTFRAGESLAETINTPHNGKNTGTGPLRLFIVFAGAEGVKNTTPVITTAPAQR